MSISSHGENAYLNALFNNDGVEVGARHVQLHTGDPGDDGTANAAGETARKSLAGSAAVNGTFTSVNDLVWTDVAATEEYSHISIWDAAGNCWWSGALTVAKAVNAGDTFTIAAGALTVSLD